MSKGDLLQMNKLLYAIGIGPGGREGITIAAEEAMQSCDTIVGYSVYIDLVKDRLPGKKFISTPMTKETDRCLLALEEANGGHATAMICSGDAGVYGMASLLYQMRDAYPEVEIRVIPGVTAALSGAALLGSPLSCDFCAISLSDYLTPADVIEKRLKAAGEGDFCIVLYNPGSRKRKGYLAKACDILLAYRDPGTICGIVRNIGREGEEAMVLSLEQLRSTEPDMFTTVFIGNSTTLEIAGRMVTPRGYQL